MLEDLPSDFSRVLEVWSPRGGKRITADPAGRYRNLRFVNYSLTKRAFGDRPPAFEFSLSRRSILSPRDSVAHPVRTLPPLGGAGAVFLNTFKTLYTHQCAPASLASPRDGRREGVVGLAPQARVRLATGSSQASSVPDRRAWAPHYIGYLLKCIRLAGVPVTPAQIETVLPLQDNTGFEFHRTLIRARV